MRAYELKHKVTEDRAKVIRAEVSKSQKARRLISAKERNKRQLSINRTSKRAIRIACAFCAWRRVPRHHYSIATPASPKVPPRENTFATISVNMRRHSLDLDSVCLRSSCTAAHTPRSADRARSPAGVSQKREYFRCGLETMGDFALRLFKFGA